MFKRIIIYILGVFILALGLVLNSKTNLGVSPILSVPFVLSQFTPLSFGLATTVVYVIFVLIQIILLKKLDIKILLQIPFSYAFGLIIDFYNMFIIIKNPSFIFGLILLLLAIFFTALGVTLMLQMELIVNPADGMVNTIAEVLHLPFRKVKLGNDICMIMIALILCLCFIHQLVGVGIGTITAAICTGPTINVINKYIGQPLTKINLESKR